MKPKVDTPQFLKRQSAVSALISLLENLKIKSANFGHYHDERVHKFVHRQVEFIK